MPRIGICNRRIDTYAHDVARCTRFGRAGPTRRIRRAPWRSPDLRSDGTEPGDACFRPLRRGSITATDGSSSVATRPFSPSKSVPFDGRSIQPPGALLTYPRNETRGANAGSPLVTPFLVWTEGVSGRHLS